MRYIDANKLIAEIEKRFWSYGTPFFDDVVTAKVDEILSFIDANTEQPSEDLEKAAREEFEKNRLAACDKQTKEEYEREMDFATGIIEKEHRQPTFTDAINYGMQLQKEQDIKLILHAKDSWYKEGFIKGQIEGLSEEEKYQQGRFDEREQMMKDTVEGEVCILGRVAYVKEKSNSALKQYILDNFKNGDNVKITIVKDG